MWYSEAQEQHGEVFLLAPSPGGSHHNAALPGCPGSSFLLSWGAFFIVQPFINMELPCVAMDGRWPIMARRESIQIPSLFQGGNGANSISLFQTVNVAQGTINILWTDLGSFPP